MKAHYATKRATGEIEAPPVSTEEALEALGDDQRAGRTVKLDVRLSPEEKTAWYPRCERDGLDRLGVPS